MSHDASCVEAKLRNVWFTVAVDCSVTTENSAIRLPRRREVTITLLWGTPNLAAISVVTDALSCAWAALVSSSCAKDAPTTRSFPKTILTRGAAVVVVLVVALVVACVVGDG